MGDEKKRHTTHRRKPEFSISSSQNHLHYFSVVCQHVPADAAFRTEQHKGKSTGLYKDLLLFSFWGPKLIFCIFHSCFFTGILIRPRHFLFSYSPCHFCLISIIAVQDYTSSALKTLVSALLVPLISSNMRRLSHLNCVPPQSFPFSPSVAVRRHSQQIMRHEDTSVRGKVVF